MRPLARKAVDDDEEEDISSADDSELERLEECLSPTAGSGGGDGSARSRATEKIKRWYRKGEMPISSRHTIRDALRCLFVMLLSGFIFATALWSLPFRSNEEQASRAEALHRTRSAKTLVNEVYTFGSPGSATEPLIDESSTTGCFDGLRVFTAAMRPGWPNDVEVSDPVSWITEQFNYSHPKMQALKATDYNVKDAELFPCSTTNLPARDGFWWTGGHTGYESILRSHVEYLKLVDSDSKSGRRLTPLDLSHGPGVAAAEAVAASKDPELAKIGRALLMVHFAFMIYSKATEKLALDARDMGWIVAGVATVEDKSRSPFGGGGSPSLDHAALFQNPETLECVLAFEGTDGTDQADLLSDADAFSTAFCDLTKVHSGFKYKLMRMVSSPDYREAIHAKLGYCSRVAVTGHSLGGAQAELFAACANRRHHVTDGISAEYGLIHFEKRSPKVLRDFYLQPSDGKVIRNLETGLCLDVRGTLQSTIGAMIGLYDCEGASSKYSKDQRWNLTEDGQLLNRYSNMCMSIDDSTSPPSLNQLQCSTGGENQTWTFTSGGYLRNKGRGTCVDAKMVLVDCPLENDLAWRRDGETLTHVASGLCLDVTGNPGQEAHDKIVLWECEGKDSQSDQRWIIENTGRLRNKLSGLCVSPISNNQDSLQQLVLADCEEDDESAMGNLRLIYGSDGLLRSKASGLCVLGSDRPAKSGSPVVLGLCEPQAFSGMWKLDSEGFIRNVNLGIAWESTEDCIEVFGTHDSGEKLKEGAALHLDVCEVGTDQMWLFQGGKLKNAIGARKCMDTVFTPEEKEHDILHLGACAEYAGVTWEISGDGAIRSTFLDRCIGIVRSLETGSAPLLKAVSCSHSAENVLIHVWNYEGDGYIVDELTGKCLSFMATDDATSSSLAEPVLTLETCQTDLQQATTLHQRWHFSENVLVPRSATHTSWCVGTTTQNSPDESQVDLVVKSCPQFTQSWGLDEGQQIENKKLGLCLDVEEDIAGVLCHEGATDIGSCVKTKAGKWERVVTSHCDPMRVRQRWEVL
mmetsp:Transcript_71777/g.149955  ORF Transcript_71777/g.149955 Transcript_71777/m.149955 type:complete len:1032 (-) Transcript_71777:295-3390(-)